MPAKRMVNSIIATTSHLANAKENKRSRVPNLQALFPPSPSHGKKKNAGKWARAGANLQEKYSKTLSP